MKPFLIVIIILSSIVFITLLILLLINNMNNKLYSKRIDGDVRFKFQSIRDFPGLKSKNLSLQVNSKEKLNGKLFYYDFKEYKANVIFYHGLYSGYLNYINLINEVAKNGYRVIAFDMYGNMSSEGKCIKGMCLGDVLSKRIIEYVLNEKEFGNYPLYTLGHSWGGHVSLVSALHSEKVIKSCAFSPYNSNVDVAYSLFPIFKVIAPFAYLYNILRFGHYASYSGKEAIKYSDAKFLVFHGQQDDVVKYKYSMKKLVNTKKNNGLDNVELVSYKDRNHFIYMCKEGSLNYQKEVMFPRTTPVNFKGIRYDLINKLDEDVMKKLIEFFDN